MSLGNKSIVYMELECTGRETSVKEPAVQAVLRVYEQYGVEDVIIWPHMGGSAPMYLYTREPLNLPLVSGGLGHGAGAHSPDEYLVVEGNDKVAGLVRAEQPYVDILYTYAEWPPPSSPPTLGGKEGGLDIGVWGS
ncbi:MAG: hypothetical protein WBW48_02300 [Anaerolineae bacterium]